jgi:hypothetical protein
MGNINVAILLFLGLGCVLSIANARHLPRSNRFRCKTRDVHVNQGRSGISDTSYRWSTFRIFIERAFTSSERQAIVDEVEYLRGLLPCVRFQVVRRVPSGDYVHVTKEDDGCHSQLGRIGGRQDLNLGPGCFEEGTVIHELLHAMGIIHEHNRSDRDDFVDILWQNMDPQMQDQFEKVSDREFSNYGVAYNADSVMHYDSYSTSANGQPVVLTKAGREIGWQTEIQQSDIDKLQNMYGCS